MRPEIGIVEERGHTRRIRPDLAVVVSPGGKRGESVAVFSRRAPPSRKSVELTVRSEPIRHAYVEIRDPSRVTPWLPIESSAPNKRRGRTGDLLAKQSEIWKATRALLNWTCCGLGTAVGGFGAGRL